MVNETTLVHILEGLPVILEEMTFKRGNAVHLWITNESQMQAGAILIFITMTNGKTGELLSLQILDIIII
jgi:hypothetical protein